MKVEADPTHLKCIGKYGSEVGATEIIPFFVIISGRVPGGMLVIVKACMNSLIVDTVSNGR